MPVSSGCSGRAGTRPEPPLAADDFADLERATRSPYTELFERAPRLGVGPRELEAMQRYYEEAEEYCVARFEEQEDRYEERLRDARAELRQRGRGMSADERRDLECRVHNLDLLQRRADALADNAIPAAFDNKEAKLTLIGDWPEALAQVRREKESGRYRNRPFADVNDIGSRGVGIGQRTDVEMGWDAIGRMRREGVLPPEVRNEVVVDYVEGLGQRLAEHSDLRVPLELTVLNTVEINAFALPGGFVFIQRGLLEASQDEAPLASLIYQAAAVTGAIATGGSIGPLLRAGYYGLGFALDLRLLGVSREFELEADQLGVQYLWASGYDLSGFIRFFDKMANSVGYVEGLSWFRTHPPFYDRMVQTKREIIFLPSRDQLTVDTEAFQRMKQELADVAANVEDEDLPTRRQDVPEPPRDCPAPEKLEYEPERSLEEICRLRPSAAAPVSPGS